MTKKQVSQINVVQVHMAVLKSRFHFFYQNFIFNADEFQSRKIAYPENMNLKGQLVLKKLKT